MTVKIQSLNTPVLFLTFNRIDTVKKVFEEIRKAKPKQLFIASDGPRENKEGEKNIVEEVRRYILKSVDWDCNVKTLFRDKNLGCKYAVSGAIDWFFENVEQGIILEDDCLPDQSFFKYCEELLKKYKDEKRIMMISGDNFIENETGGLRESYYFSRNANIWGWASWRRAWKKYDVNIYNKLKFGQVKAISEGFLEYLINKKKIRDLKKNKINTWDYQWDFIIKSNNGLSVIPKTNLIKNIGFDQKNFTNTKTNKVDVEFLQMETKRMDFPLIHPDRVERNKMMDGVTRREDLKRRILKRIWIKN